MATRTDVPRSVAELIAAERAVPFPRVCMDCFHEECIALVDAWRLLTDDFKKNPPFELTSSVPAPRGFFGWLQNLGR